MAASGNGDSITTEPAVSFGRPCIVGTGVPAEEVYSRFVVGDSVGELAGDYGIPKWRIEAAIRYWIKHKEEGDEEAVKS